MAEHRSASAIGEPSDAFAEAMRDLVKAAAAFGVAAGAEYKRERPADWEQLINLFNTGEGELLAMVTLSPAVAVELMLVVAGERHVFFRTNARERGVTIN